MIQNGLSCKYIIFGHDWYFSLKWDFLNWIVIYRECHLEQMEHAPEHVPCSGTDCSKWHSRVQTLISTFPKIFLLMRNSPCKLEIQILLVIFFIKFHGQRPWKILPYIFLFFYFYFWTSIKRRSSKIEGKASKPANGQWWLHWDWWSTWCGTPWHSHSVTWSWQSKLTAWFWFFGRLDSISFDKLLQ